MIESLLILIIGFSFLFYFILKVDKKIESMNEYRIRVFEDKYNVLLKNNEEESIITFSYISSISC